MATLSYSDLSKRNNWDVLLEKIENKHSFLDTTIGKEVTIILTKDTVNRMKSLGMEKSMGAFKKGSSYEFPSSKGTLRLTNIYKSADFGGVGSTVKKETLQLNSLNKQIKDYMIKKKVDFVPIRVNNKDYKIVMAVSTPKTPKSDFHLIDINGNACVWMSHKDGNSPKSFQQYGGFTEKGMYDKEIYLKKFVDKVKSLYYNELSKGVSLGCLIGSNNNNIKAKAIYGVDYGKSKGENNVDLVVQGNVQLSNGTIIGSSHTWSNGFIPSGEYDPIMLVRYADRDQYNIKRARFMISPKGGRLIKDWVKI